MKEKKKITLKYGKGEIEFEIPADMILCELMANKVETSTTGDREIIRSLENPIGSLVLEKILSPKDSVCIVTSDITRPCPSNVILPHIIERVESAGVLPESITIVLGLGSHREHTLEEKKHIVGEGIYNRIKVVDSDPSDTVCLGKTSRGTPVNITRIVAKADKRICLGNIEMHYFAGYSGGTKAIMPGVSDRNAIQSNHAMMVEDKAKAGRTNENPVRMDIDEAANMCGIDYILNVVLDEDKNIVKAVSGDCIKAHRAGCDFLDRMYKVQIPEKADIVIASAGGFPKDINLYQAQKALDNAQHAVKEGGTIILVAKCDEGLGETVFEQWIERAKTPADLIKRVKEDFQLGGHKAAAIAMVLEKTGIILVSSLPGKVVERTFMSSASDIQNALKKATEKAAGDAKIIIMPQAGSTLPILRKE